MFNARFEIELQTLVCSGKRCLLQYHKYYNFFYKTFLRPGSVSWKVTGFLMLSQCIHTCTTVDIFDIFHYSVCESKMVNHQKCLPSTRVAKKIVKNEDGAGTKRIQNRRKSKKSAKTKILFTHWVALFRSFFPKCFRSGFGLGSVFVFHDSSLVFVFIHYILFS